MWVLSSQRAPSQGQVLEEGMEGGNLGKSSGPRMERSARPGEGQRAWPREALGTDLGLGRAGQLHAQLWRGGGGGLLEEEQVAGRGRPWSEQGPTVWPLMEAHSGLPDGLHRVSICGTAQCGAAGSTDPDPEALEGPR